MKVIATNIAKIKEISYQGKNVKTGIYKYPVAKGIYLGEQDVQDDNVVDRRFHGGKDKACYLYGMVAYSFWKQEYPDLEWNYGMLGENLTVLGLDERLMRIGEQYKIGEAIIEVSQPRQPCYKLGIRFGSQSIIKKFINTTYSGVYVRVLKNGWVKPEDAMELILEKPENPSIAEVFYCLYQSELKSSLLDKVLNCEELPENNKKDIQRRLH